MLEIFTIVAILLGPIGALWIERYRDKQREERDEKLWVFKTLMGTRGARVSPAHVQALNMIDLVFSHKDSAEKKIVDVWSEYRDHLSKFPTGDGPASESDKSRWYDTGDELLISLLFEMSKAVGHKFDRVQLKNGGYSPRKYSDDENEHWLIRQGILNVLYGKSGIPIYQFAPNGPDKDKVDMSAN